MEELKRMKENLTSCVQAQMGNLHEADSKELGEAVDMIKDLAEAIYYCTITEAMEDKYEPKKETYYYTEKYIPEYYRDMDYPMGRTYYTTGGNQGGSSSMAGSRGYISSGLGGGRGVYHYQDDMYLPMHDYREGRSPMSRKMYMESKEKGMDKDKQMKELEKYMKELSEDLTEMIEGSTPEEKMVLNQKLVTLANKVME